MAPKRRISGITSSIPAGYVLGRVAGGEGDVGLISISDLGNQLVSSGVVLGGAPPAVSLIAGTGISVSAAVGAVTISNTGVVSVAGTTNRLTASAATGAITLDISASYVGQASITTLGTVATGTWQAGVVAGQYGGTGVANTGKTITLGGNLTVSGAFATTMTVTATTNSTLPAGTHTLAGLDVAQTWSAAQTFSFGADSSLALDKGSVLTTYNIVSLNGNKTLAGAIGLLGGATGDAALNYLSASGGSHVFFVNGNHVATFASGGLTLNGSTSGTLIVKPPAAAGANTITLPAGTTDFSATGGTSQFVKQASVGAALTVAQPAAADLSDFTTWTAHTPTVTSGSGTFTTVSGTQRWFKIGKLVHVIGSVTITTNGTAASDVFVPIPTAPGTATGTIFATGRASAVSGKAMSGSLTSRSSVLGIAFTNYDNTYPGASGEVIVFSYFYEVS